jgi:hypothetical protein
MSAAIKGAAADGLHLRVSAAGVVHVGHDAHAQRSEFLCECRARHRPLVNKDIPIYRVQTMESLVAESYWESRFFGNMFAIFAALALFLAALGLYGVMAYSCGSAPRRSACGWRSARRRATSSGWSRPRVYVSLGWVSPSASSPLFS